jgi:excisionase family DNA binding protein
MPETIHGDLLSTNEAASYLDVSRATIYREFNAGRLAMRKMRGRTRWHRAELDRWLRELPERRTA